VYQLYSNWEPDISPEEFKTKVRTSDRIACVAVVGLGGAGKTTLIKALTGCDRIDPRVPSNGICPVVLGREDKSGWWWFGSTTRTSIIYCDSDGQRPQTFVTAVLTAGKGDILFKGCFDALVFVLDVKAPARVMHLDEEVVDSVDWRRLSDHVEEWSETALSYFPKLAQIS
jgi:hypothetical protein